MGLELVASAFVVLVALKCLSRRGVPEYLCGVCIAGAYFVATASTALFSFSGANPAKSLPLVVLAGRFVDIPLYLAVPFVGALVGLALFYVLDVEKKKSASRFYAEQGRLTRNAQARHRQQARLLRALRQRRPRQGAEVSAAPPSNKTLISRRPATARLYGGTARFKRPPFNG